MFGQESANGTTTIPHWSGEFFEFEDEDLGMMLVSNADIRQHHPPLGWEPIHHSTCDTGEFEVYTYRRSMGFS